MRRRGAGLAERLWRRVDRRGPYACWNWQGACDRWGYGKIMIGRRTLATHRVAWELARGPIPPGSHVLHTCDNPRCCNPGHLFLGSHITNMQDRNAKGRAAAGERNGQSRLTEREVRYIRVAWPHVSMRTLGHQFGVNASTIFDVIHRRTWKGVR